MSDVKSLVKEKGAIKKNGNNTTYVPSCAPGLLCFLSTRITMGDRSLCQASALSAHASMIARPLFIITPLNLSIAVTTFI